MDMKVAKKKLGMKERYRALTRDLGWEPSYQSKDALFPYVKYEGIKVHDWDTPSSTPMRRTTATLTSPTHAICRR